MHIDPEALLALAGLEPMPRRELTVNPCPEGYALTNVGGSLMCVLEGAEELSLEEAIQQKLSMSKSQQGATRARRSSNPPTRPIVSGPISGPSGKTVFGGGR